MYMCILLSIVWMYIYIYIYVCMHRKYAYIYIYIYKESTSTRKSLHQRLICSNMTFVSDISVQDRYIGRVALNTHTHIHRWCVSDMRTIFPLYFHPKQPQLAQHTIHVSPPGVHLPESTAPGLLPPPPPLSHTQHTHQCDIMHLATTPEMRSNFPLKWLDLRLPLPNPLQQMTDSSPPPSQLRRAEHIKYRSLL